MSLSDKSQYVREQDFFRKRDVKEAVRELKKFIKGNSVFSDLEFIQLIDEIFGEDLI